MDRDTADLVVQLCTRAGITMEDASPSALMIGSTPKEEWSVTIDQLIADAERSAAFLEAARRLVRD